MSMDLVRLGIIVLLVTPAAVDLYVFMGELSRGKLISMRVLRGGIVSLDVIKSAASSAS